MFGHRFESGRLHFFKALEFSRAFLFISDYYKFVHPFFKSDLTLPGPLPQFNSTNEKHANKIREKHPLLFHQILLSWDLDLQ